MDNREYLNYENIDIPELTDYRGTLKEFATIVLALMKEYLSLIHIFYQGVV